MIAQHAMAGGGTRAEVRSDGSHTSGMGGGERCQVMENQALEQGKAVIERGQPRTVPLRTMWS
ncbi:MAG TPA: hypothetical protein VFG50_08920 [Rhodothermales bacterium]|nr:hypothetical protein [Rhodothermales bacterium]